MCGIVGYVGKRKAIPVLIQGLEQLEYRGYDSAGIACLDADHSNLVVFKEKGKISELKSHLNGSLPPSYLGIGHTRWATHGEPSKTNAHPHLGTEGRIAIVHNGIVENHAKLRSEVERKGARFCSETDSEVIAQLVEQYDKGSLSTAVRQAVDRLEGFFAFVAMSSKEPDRLIALKRSNPLVIGVGKEEHFVASDVSAILPYTSEVIYLEDDELAEIERDKIKVTSLKTGKAIKKKIVHVDWTVDQAQKGGFPHFMLKEIHEQPRVIQEMFQKRVTSTGQIQFDTVGPQVNRVLKQAKKIFFVSCGTAYHAGLIGRYMFEEYARVPTDALVSSEFRYVDPIVGKGDVVVLISQSGETADTLAALREAKRKKAFTIAIVNVVGSAVAREANAVIYTHAGPEVGVASTKAYLAQLFTLALFAFYLGRIRDQLTGVQLQSLIREAKELPDKISGVLKRESELDPIAKALYEKKNFLYLGRGYNFPNALEGALKLKEITYAHAHGYAAGEMKHGPIALIDQNQPVVCLIPQSKTHAKMLSNIEEIRARRGIIIAIATEGDNATKGRSRHIFWIPNTLEVFSPLLTAVPLQLFAYKIATLNDRDVDQPRNLAKSVTVE